MAKRKVPERMQPVHEAWDELCDEIENLTVSSTMSQAALAQTVQALTECTRRLREIGAESADDD